MMMMNLVDSIQVHYQILQSCGALRIDNKMKDCFFSFTEGTVFLFFTLGTRRLKTNLRIQGIPATATTTTTTTTTTLHDSSRLSIQTKTRLTATYNNNPPAPHTHTQTHTHTHKHTHTHNGHDDGIGCKIGRPATVRGRPTRDTHIKERTQGCMVCYRCSLRTKAEKRKCKITRSPPRYPRLRMSTCIILHYIYMHAGGQ